MDVRQYLATFAKTANDLRARCKAALRAGSLEEWRLLARRLAAVEDQRARVRCSPWLWPGAPHRRLSPVDGKGGAA